MSEDKEECKDCNGWGIIYLKSGIPNITKPCNNCDATGKVEKEIK